MLGREDFRGLGAKERPADSADFSYAGGCCSAVYPGHPDLKALFAIVGRMHNIDADLLEAMAEVESGGDPLSVSPKGALGLMQLMPATASAFSVLDPFDPVANVMGAADFLDYLRKRFANNLNLQGLPALLAAYNAGPSAVEKYDGIPPYAETHKYVRRVIERYTNDLGAQAAAAPVLILGPKPYVIQLGPGSYAMQPEPVLISADSDGSVLNQLAAIRRIARTIRGCHGHRHRALDKARRRSQPSRIAPVSSA